MLKRPDDDGWTTQACGDLYVTFRVVDYNKYGDDEVVVDWYLCADAEDKAHERALACSDREIRGPRADLDRLIDRAMVAASAAATHVAQRILAAAQIAPDQLKMTTCEPPDACATHGRCWTHSAWAEERGAT